MKDLTDYFGTPRETKTTLIPSNSLKQLNSPKKNKPSNESRKKNYGKRKREAVNDCDVTEIDDRTKVKKAATSQASCNLNGDLTVLLTHVDVSLHKTSKNGVRVFKHVLLKDCSKESVTVSKSDKSGELKPSGVKKKRKRTRIVNSDSSDTEKSDSSEKIFKDDCTTKSISVRRSEGNSLFNYFSKAEKKLPVDDEDSPIKCRRIVQVEALIHSPPKARRSLAVDSQSLTAKDSKFSRMMRVEALIESPPKTLKNDVRESLRETQSSKESRVNFDDIRTPIVKIVRADITKLNFYDEIIEVGTDFVEPNSMKESAESTLSTEEGESSSDTFVTSKIPPWKMRVQFASSGKLHRRPKKSKSRETVVMVESSDESVEKVVDAEQSNETETSQPVTGDQQLVSNEDKPVIKKLAPLFCRPPSTKKVSPKPADTEARRLFLESGVPDCIKKKMEEQRNLADEHSEYRPYRFPECTHVQQKDGNSFVWKLQLPTDFRVNSTTTEEILVPKNENYLSLLSDRKILSSTSIQQTFDVRQEVVALSKLEPDVDVDDVFASIKNMSKETDSKNGILCWTEKYKPTTYADIIGNSTLLVKLKEWIESHKRTKIQLSPDDGSSNEFVDSDDSNSSAGARNNVALLVGPSGCGKTCAVYTLANELGFKVLEVNASCNRTGKRILDELQEATQSHRVKRTTIFDKDIKKLKKKKKVKSEKKTMSLILIEDADILFENHDDGFLSALNSLTLNSKRPFIFTANNINCSHLARYTKTQNLVLTFTYPSRALLNVWLQSIALNEGVKLSDEILMCLSHVAGLDVRKSLLQLQMMISSKLHHFEFSSEQLFYTNWLKQVTKTDCVNILSQTAVVIQPPIKLFSDDEEESTPEESSLHCQETQVYSKNINDKLADLKELNQLANSFQKVAFLGKLENVYADYPIIFSERNTVINHENVSFYNCQLRNDISEAFKSRIFAGDCVIGTSFSFKEYCEKTRDVDKIGRVVDNVFCQFGSLPSTAISKYCDYLPAIRHIARIERSKESGQRRTNRYFSYLNSINVRVSDSETKFLCNSLS